LSRLFGFRAGESSYVGTPETEKQTAFDLALDGTKSTARHDACNDVLPVPLILAPGRCVETTLIGPNLARTSASLDFNEPGRQLVLVLAASATLA
jgi:hypothetical protein